MELLELLPKQFKIDGTVLELHINFDPKVGSYIYYIAEGEYVEHEFKDDKSLLNSLAKMLIYLLENKLLEI